MPEHFKENLLLAEKPYAPSANRRVNIRKKHWISSVLLAPVSVEMLNLWNDFRRVVKFIDENPWVTPMLERIVENKKNRGMR